jgi:hypothetical protein
MISITIYSILGTATLFYQRTNNENKRVSK